jgi:hypothetical protein
VLGMTLTATSLVGMPLLGFAKQRVAQQLGSQATHGERTQNLLCAYLAGAVLLGLAGNAALGWWWLDPSAALVIVAVALKEGLETWRGEGCCAAPPPPQRSPASTTAARITSEPSAFMCSRGLTRRRTMRARQTGTRGDCGPHHRR